jgi:creatinine amidohydrolase
MTHLTRRSLLLAGTSIPLALEATSLQGVGQPAEPERFELVTGRRLAGTIESGRLALLPCGSLEYHGPHNPLGTDSLIISGIAERVAIRTNAVLLPVVNFTHCPAHTSSFQGTLSVRPEVMTLYFEEILRSLTGAGFRRILVLNGHDGNIGPARGAISRVTAEVPAASILLVSWWETLPSDEMVKLDLFHQANGGHGHGGPLETSAVAAFHPNLVELDRARDLPSPPDFSAGFPYYLEKSAAEGWPGYSGRISEASAEKGKRIVAMSEDRIVELVQKWLEAPTLPGSW